MDILKRLCLATLCTMLLPTIACADDWAVAAKFATAMPTMGTAISSLSAYSVEKHPFGAEVFFQFYGYAAKKPRETRRAAG